MPIFLRGLENANPLGVKYMHTYIHTTPKIKTEPKEPEI